MPITLPGEPFGDDVLPDLRLERSPLVRTIVQVRYPASTELLADSNKIFEVAKPLAAKYPTFEAGNELSFNLTPSGVTPAPNSAPRWVLRSLSGDDVVAVSPTSISLESKVYSNREGLLDLLQEILTAALPVVRPAYIERVGVRYTNHVDAPPLISSLSDLFRSELLQARQIPLGRARITQTFTESVYDFGDQTGLTVRSGSLPAGATVDPSITPAQTESFVLDLDAYSQNRIMQPAVDDLLRSVSLLAEHAYRYFLWSLTPTGVSTFGGIEK